MKTSDTSCLLYLTVSVLSSFRRFEVVWEGGVRDRAVGHGVLLHRVHPAAVLDRGAQRVLHRQGPL